MKIKSIPIKESNLSFWESVKSIDIQTVLVYLLLFVLILITAQALSKYLLNKAQKKLGTQFYLINKKELSQGVLVSVACLFLLILLSQNFFQKLLGSISVDLLSSCIFILLFFSLYKLLTPFSSLISKLTTLNKSERFQKNTENYLKASLKFLLIVFFSLGILSIWVKNLSALITGLGIGGIAIALAAKDPLSNFFSSISLMLDAPFQIGDYIVSGDIQGTVLSVGLRSTRIRQIDNSELTVPNQILAANSVSNATLRPRQRLDLCVNFSINNEAEKLQKLITNVENKLRKIPQVDLDGGLIYIEPCSENTLTLHLRFFTTVPYDEKLKLQEQSYLLCIEEAKILELNFVPFRKAL